MKNYHIGFEDSEGNLQVYKKAGTDLVKARELAKKLNSDMNTDMYFVIGEALKKNHLEFEGPILGGVGEGGAFTMKGVSGGSVIAFQIQTVSVSKSASGFTEVDIEAKGYSEI